MNTLLRRRVPRRDDTRHGGAFPDDGAEVGRARSLVLVAFVPGGLAAVGALAVALLVLLTAGGGLGGLPGAVGAMWLVLHQAPVYIGDLQLGALPLLPTALMVVAVAVYARRSITAEDPPLRHLAIIGAAAGGPAVITVVAVLLIDDATAALPVTTIGAVPSVLIVAAVHAVAAAVGVGLGAARRYADEWALPALVWPVLRSGAVALGALLAAGAVLVVLGLLLGWGRVQDGFAAEPSVVGKLGLLVLSVLYLPNLAIGGAAVLVGTAAHVGAADFSLFAVAPGPAPAVPVLGVLPTSPISPVWAAALLVPAVIALGCAAVNGVRGRTLADQARYVVSVAAVAAAGALLLGYLAGGTVGIFDSIGVEAPMFALAVLGWNAAAGAVVVLVGDRMPVPAWPAARAPRWLRRSGDDGAEPADPDGERAAEDGEGEDDLLPSLTDGDGKGLS
ncbi:DUF6350 family protein [Tomitella fengzijianii]|uniref:Uncharacterized protein n=1 Tax=Tomitella fengzijianii TaxID=2597660 RepID=A0A516X1Y5_9ACTN|nr:DUF6350 family protein [Tomitella fengzijianii]QDQ97027.1 hypothetical protein FO059_06355 [Tomitella fengzijianii]